MIIYHHKKINNLNKHQLVLGVPYSLSHNYLQNSNSQAIYKHICIPEKNIFLNKRQDQIKKDIIYEKYR